MNHQRHSDDDSRNRPLLDELNALGTWFAARKTRPIWVKLLERPELIRTLEGDQQVPTGTYLCRGESGDVWPQAADRVHRKYRLSTEVDSSGMTKCFPREEGAGVLAIEVPHPFRVESHWGTFTGKAGDFALKNIADQHVLYPTDLWIVDRHHFAATYERV
ncbi:MAG: hypothetical protein ACKOUR_16600 [Planctomycetota bacterium]